MHWLLLFPPLSFHITLLIFSPIDVFSLPYMFCLLNFGANTIYGIYNSIAYVLNYYCPFGSLLLVSGSIVESFPDCATRGFFCFELKLFLSTGSADGFLLNRMKQGTVLTQSPAFLYISRKEKDQNSWRLARSFSASASSIGYHIGSTKRTTHSSPCAKRTRCGV